MTRGQSSGSTPILDQGGSDYRTRHHRGVWPSGCPGAWQKRVESGQEFPIHHCLWIVTQPSDGKTNFILNCKMLEAFPLNKEQNNMTSAAAAVQHNIGGSSKCNKNK